MKQLTFIIALTMLLDACGRSSSSPPDEAPKNRRIDHQAQYPMVAWLNLGFGTCSGIVLRHGLLVTARHCVVSNGNTPMATSEISAKFFGTALGDIQLEPSAWKSLTLDENAIDAAYLTYAPKLTAEAFDLGGIELATPADVSLGGSVLHVGFPATNLGTKRIITEPCSLTSRKGPMPNARDAAKYPGTLQEAACPAWYGDSGGPVLLVQHNPTAPLSESVRMKFLGVTSHTFDIDANGSLLTEAVASDAFGSFGRSLNFAPLSELHSLERLLDETRAALGEASRHLVTARRTALSQP